MESNKLGKNSKTGETIKRVEPVKQLGPAKHVKPDIVITNIMVTFNKTCQTREEEKNGRSVKTRRTDNTGWTGKMSKMERRIKPRKDEG